MSRTALTLAILFGLAFAPAAPAQSVLPLDADVLGEIARREALDGDAGASRSPGCEPSSSEEEIVVCAPGRSPSFRVPYRPAPGAPPIRAMGELPRAVEAFDDCHRLCDRGVWVRIDVGKLLTDPGGALRDILRGR